MRISEIQVSYMPKRAHRPQIKDSKDIHRVLQKIYPDDKIEHHEMFYIVLLNRANRVMGCYKVSEGGVAGTVVDAKMVFSVAVKCMASSIILSHNHPSGSMLPSQADIDLTRKLVNAGKTLDIVVLDHLIISPHGYYYSFADEGKI